MKSLYEWCIENNRKDILQSWDSDRNKGITPSNVSYGSNKKYYWLCEIGHSWLMAPKDRRISKRMELRKKRRAKTNRCTCWFS